MMTSHKLLLLFVALVCGRETVRAQETQFLPETDLYMKLKPALRLWGQATDTRDGGDPTQASIGPSLDFYVKPLVRLKRVAAFDLDDAKTRTLILSAGYRYQAAPGSDPTNQILLMGTFHLPAKPDLLVSDRNRFELDWRDGHFKWRYRNRLTIEKPLKIRSYRPAPYASVEVYYESQYRKWSTTEVYVGCLFPIRSHFELDPYYEHQNNTGGTTNSQLHGIGLKLNIYLSVR
jgi:hypothetical protein